MKKIKLEIVGLSYSQTQSGAYALVLGEEGGKRRLPIIIGGFEAQAIALELEKMVPTRPLTHDLFKSFASTFNITIDEIIIYKLEDGIFFSKLICNDGTTTEEIDARTSDAIAIAVRFNASIFTFESVLSSAGILMEEKGTPEIEPKKPAEKKDKKVSDKDLPNQTLDSLNELLRTALDGENYEKAARIRDELNRRKSSQ